MRNAEYGMRSVTPHQSPDGDSFPSRGSLESEVEEITSVQVLFPDRRTLDEVIAELRDKIKKLESKVGDTIEDV